MTTLTQKKVAGYLRDLRHANPAYEADLARTMAAELRLNPADTKTFLHRRIELDWQRLQQQKPVQS